MTRLRAPALVIALSAAFGCGGEDPPPRVPNGSDVFLCVIDTLRADHVGCYGYERNTTPNIDRFAKRGARLANVWSQASWTGPSMVSMMTGLHVGADFVRMPDARTLAERMKAAGYRTYGVQYNVLLAPGTGYERGFDAYLMEPGPKEIAPLFAAGDDRPRFLYLHLVDPHDPYRPFERFDVFRARTPDARRVQRVADYLRETHPDWPREEIESAALAAARTMEEQIALYDGDVRQADSVLQTFLDLIAREGRLDRTVVVVAADHGECLWDHRESAAVAQPEHAGDPLFAFKRTHNSLLTEELLHVPLLFGGPGVPEGIELHGLAENVDIVPTLLELLGLANEPALDGESLVPRFREAAAGGNPVGKPLAFANIALASAVRDRDGFKLVSSRGGHGETLELFDLNADPDETNPLTPDGDVGTRLARALNAFQTRALRPGSGEDTIDDEIRRRFEQLGYLGK